MLISYNLEDFNALFNPASNRCNVCFWENILLMGRQPVGEELPTVQNLEGL